jgi:hypothetical protein
MDEGKLAASNGDALTSNPYPTDSEEHETWSEGWHYVHGTDEEGEPLNDA